MATVAVLAQQPDPTTVQRLAETRPLSTTEIDQVLDRVRQVSGGRPFHLTGDAIAADILVERDGHVRYVRGAGGGTFTEYTGRIARYCDGAVAAGEFVYEYRQTTSGWTVSARASSPADLLRPIFDMLVGIKPMVDAGHTRDGGRAFSNVWNAGLAATGRSPRGGGGAGAPTFVLADPTISGIETLVIDVTTLLPLRWEFTYRITSTPGGPDRVTVPYRFSYDSTLMLAPPAANLTLPTCAEPGLGR
jgi:hypothetical protein